VRACGEECTFGSAWAKTRRGGNANASRGRASKSGKDGSKEEGANSDLEDHTVSALPLFLCFVSAPVGLRNLFHQRRDYVSSSGGGCCTVGPCSSQPLVVVHGSLRKSNLFFRSLLRSRWRQAIFSLLLQKIPSLA
jgi:hypothetical protein